MGWLLTCLLAAAAQGDGTPPPQIKLPPGMRLPPPVVRPKRPIMPPSGAATPKPVPSSPEKERSLTLHYRVTTEALEVVASGKPIAAPPPGAFSPVRIAVGALEVVGGASAVPASAPFSPVRLTVSPLEVVGGPIGDRP